MKFPLLAAAAAVTAALVAPKLIGTQTETFLNERVAALDAMPMYGASLQNVKTGWFGMSAELLITLDLSEGVATTDTQEAMPEMPVIELTFDLKTQHGPVLGGESPGIGLVSWQSTLRDSDLREHISWPQEKAFLTQTGLVSLLGNVSFEDSMSAFSVNDATTPLNVGAFNAQGSYASGTLNYAGKLGEVKSAETNASSLYLAPMSISMQADATLEQMFAGSLYDSTFELQAPEFTVGDLPMMSMKGLVMSGGSQTSEDGSQGNVAVTYKMNSLTAAGVDVTDVTLAIELNKISSAFAIAMNRFNADFAKADDQEAFAQKFAEEQLLPQLLLEPELNLTDVSFSMPQGSFKGKANSAIKGVTSLPTPIEDPAFWMQHALAEGNASADKALVAHLVRMNTMTQIMQDPQAQDMDAAQLQQIVDQQAPVMLDALIQQGLMVEDGETYRTEFSLKEGKAQLNGQEIPLPVGQ